MIHFHFALVASSPSYHKGGESCGVVAKVLLFDAPYSALIEEQSL